MKILTILILAICLFENQCLRKANEQNKNVLAVNSTANNTIDIKPQDRAYLFAYLHRGKNIHYYTTDFKQLGGGANGFIRLRNRAVILKEQYPDTYPLYEFYNWRSSHFKYSLSKYANYGGFRRNGIVGYVYKKYEDERLSKYYIYWDRIHDDYPIKKKCKKVSFTIIFLLLQKACYFCKNTIDSIQGEIDCCNKRFCFDCLEYYAEKNFSCPICLQFFKNIKQILQKNFVPKTLLIDQFLASNIVVKDGKATFLNCVGCKKKDDTIKYYQYNNQIYCKECFQNLVFQCSFCKDQFAKQNILTQLNERTFTCENCMMFKKCLGCKKPQHDIFEDKNSPQIYFNLNNLNYCHKCYYQKFTKCYFCKKITPPSQLKDHGTPPRRVCSNCYQNNQCNLCLTIISGQVFLVENKKFCKSCYEQKFCQLCTAKLVYFVNSNIGNICLKCKEKNSCSVCKQIYTNSDDLTMKGENKVCKNCLSGKCCASCQQKLDKYFDAPIGKICSNCAKTKFCYGCFLELEFLDKQFILEGVHYCETCKKKLFCACCEKKLTQYFTIPIGNICKICYAEKICVGCRQLVNEEERFIRNSKIFCQKCRTERFCQFCEKEFTGKFLMNEAGQRFCIECQQKNFCFKCNKHVPPESKIEKEGKIFCQDCFKISFCVRCNKLIEKKIINVNGQQHCQNCFSKYYCSKCSATLDEKNLMVCPKCKEVQNQNAI